MQNNEAMMVKITWRRFRTIWTQTTWIELGTLSYLACLTCLTQFVLFFWLMHDWPGMTNNMRSVCERMRYISENIGLNKGKASVMVVTMLPSFVILGIMNSYERPSNENDRVRWLTRPLVNFFAVIAYVGCVGVVLYDQNAAGTAEESDRQQNMHILSAFLLSLSYVVVHWISAVKFQSEYVRLGKKYMVDWLYSLFYAYGVFNLVYACVNIFLLALYSWIYIFGACQDTTVSVEYILYFGTVVFNIFVYFQFTIVHVLAKIDFRSLFMP